MSENKKICRLTDQKLARNDNDLKYEFVGWVLKTANVEEDWLLICFIDNLFVPEKRRKPLAPELISVYKSYFLLK